MRVYSLQYTNYTKQYQISETTDRWQRTRDLFINLIVVLIIVAIVAVISTCSSNSSVLIWISRFHNIRFHWLGSCLFHTNVLNWCVLWKNLRKSVIIIGLFPCGHIRISVNVTFKKHPTRIFHSKVTVPTQFRMWLSDLIISTMIK